MFWQPYTEGVKEKYNPGFGQNFLTYEFLPKRYKDQKIKDSTRFDRAWSVQKKIANECPSSERKFYKVIREGNQTFEAFLAASNLARPKSADPEEVHPGVNSTETGETWDLKQEGKSDSEAKEISQKRLGTTSADKSEEKS